VTRSKHAHRASRATSADPAPQFSTARPFQNLQHGNADFVVGRDLNERPRGSAELIAARTGGFAGFERRTLTFPAWGRVSALDAIFVRGDME